MIYTTFKLGKEAGACAESYKKMGKHLDGITKYGRDKPIPLTEVLDVLGIDDALWALCYCSEGENKEQLARQFSYDCAMHADVIGIYEKQYPGDTRVRDCLATVKRYMKGNATLEELAAARDAAWDAARDAAWDAARAAAGAAAGAAARDAAWDAAWDAARDAAWAAARAAAWAAARAAARDAEREWQKAHLKELLK